MYVLNTLLYKYLDSNNYFICRYECMYKYCTIKIRKKEVLKLINKKELYFLSGTSIQQSILICYSLERHNIERMS